MGTSLDTRCLRQAVLKLSLRGADNEAPRAALRLQQRGACMIQGTIFKSEDREKPQTTIVRAKLITRTCQLLSNSFEGPQKNWARNFHYTPASCQCTLIALRLHLHFSVFFCNELDRITLMPTLFHFPELGV